MPSELRLQMPGKMRPWMEPARHKVARGGRGGGKSWSAGELLLAKGFQQRTRILCARETQKSIKQSVHRLLSDKIETMGLGKFYDVQRDVIKGANGTEIFFTGLQDHTSDSVKSYENVDICWLEEAHKVTERSAMILIPTIRAKGSEIWWTYNPDQESDYVHKRFTTGHDNQCVNVEINWRDNPWFPEVLDVERLHLKAINDDIYNHVWEGRCRSAAGLMFKRAWFKRYELGKHPRNLSMYMSADYAVTEENAEEGIEPDWTELGTWGLDQIGDMYATDWYSGQEDPDVWIGAAVQMVKRNSPQIWFEENGVIRNAVKGALNKKLRESNVHIWREGLTSAGNKAARALGFAARASAGAVWIPNCDWGDRLINQLCSFNGQDGRTDDMVDVCSLIARGLDQMRNASPAPAPAPPPIKFGTKQMFDKMDQLDAESLAQNRDVYR